MLFDDADVCRAGHKYNADTLNYILMDKRGQIIVPLLQNPSLIMAPRVVLMKPNDTTNPHSPEGRCVFVCSASVIDNRAGDLICAYG